MKASGLLLGLVMALFLGVPVTGAVSSANPRVLMKTSLGDITLEVRLDKAPVTAANFLSYVDRKLLDGATFYRVVRLDNQPQNNVKIEVVQGGLEFTLGAKTLAPIAHETTALTGLRHEDGTISMARDAPGSASSEFFICVNAQPELDFGGRRNPDGQGFAAFGRVVSGMEIVRRIQALPDQGQMLVARVPILSVRRLN